MKHEAENRHAALSMRGVWVRYGSTVVLEDIYLTVDQGEILSIVGPNGSGKSTLLRTAMGFTAPSAGEVRVYGLPPAEIRQSGLIGYLPQRSAYNADFPLSAYDVVAMSRYARTTIFERLGADDRKAIDNALERVEMSALRPRHFGSLSGGERQRVLIARALALHPRMLILDEPSTGLDAVAQDNFYRLLVDLRDNEGMTIIIVSHDIGSVSTIVDRVACLKRNIHFHGKPSDGMPAAALEKVFGRDVYFLHHDQSCETCRRAK
ncbi:MAG TPA: metal ABC transporter ATP-binding protein [Spirochaetota bacterium]|nr:metal ABC transporter ATP-binding protein [Spirochaetota bacterium]